MPIHSVNYFEMGILPLLALSVFGGIFLFRNYAGLPFGKALLVHLACLIAGGVQIYRTGERLRHFVDSSHEVEVFFRIAAAGVFILFAVAFVLRLWGRWIGERATAEERVPGQPGVRAWFSAPNIFVGGMLILTAWLGYDFSPLLGAVLVGALLAAYPVIRMESPALAPVAAAEDLSAEREKIVSMLESGKLTAEESAELLQALGESSRAPVRSVPLSSSQRLILIGAALVALGFFLPWFVIDPGKEAGRMMQQVEQQINFPAQVNFGGGNSVMPSGFPFGDAQIKTPTLSVAGGDIQRGLGWAALLLALGAAVLPYVATTLDPATARIARLLILGIGGLIVLYLATQNLRFVGIGLVIAVSGYALQIAGAMRERLPVAA